jgi:DNA-binding beta-propeller fold protein YncE
VAVDAAGDVYVADTENGRVVELPAGATSSSQQVQLPFTGLSGPTGGGCNATDAGNNRVADLQVVPLAVTTSSLPDGVPTARR